MHPATLKFYVHHALLKRENGTDFFVKGLGILAKHPQL